MKRTHVFAAMFAVGCSEYTLEETTADYIEGEVVTADDDWSATQSEEADEAADLEFSSDLDGWQPEEFDGGTTQPGDDPPEWEPAHVASGAYWAEVNKVIENTTGSRMEPGSGEMVWAPFDTGVVSLWGVAPLETDGETLRAVGTAEYEFEGVDCTEIKDFDARGDFIDEESFYLTIRIDITGEGSECNAADIATSQPGLIIYESDFSWVAANDEVDEDPSSAE